MAVSRKIDPLRSLNIRIVQPRVEGLVSFPLDKMLFNTACVTGAYYFI